jgi:DHA2 family multidrug resistance protein
MPQKPLVNPWVIAGTVTLATFMEALDTSIANVALPHIAGSLGASQDESTWIISFIWSPTRLFCRSARTWSR